MFLTPLERPDPEELEQLLKTDPPAAVERLRLHAERGEPQLQLLLGQLLINGVGTSRDASESLRWFRAAARARVPMAMNMIGRCYEHGLGTAADYIQAARWYHRAAIYDCDWAIYNYAHMLANGRGVEKDRSAAFRWFKLAAVRGHARAMAFLGQYYENGWEAPLDLATAVCLYKRSAEAGDYRGQCSYASVLADQGRIEEALSWLRLAVNTAPPHYLAQLAPALRRSPFEALRAFAETVHLTRPATPGPGTYASRGVPQTSVQSRSKLW